jgi:hypothetical protein
MTTEPYDFSITNVVYDDDISYRQMLRTILKMESKKIMSEETLDALTQDEQDCDDAALTVALDWIYFKTRDHPLFQHLYLKAAGFMLSEDAQTGLCILLAYDNLPLFHAMFRAYMMDQDRFSDTHSTYRALHGKLFS